MHEGVQEEEEVAAVAVAVFEAEGVEEDSDSSPMMITMISLSTSSQTVRSVSTLFSFQKKHLAQAHKWSCLCYGTSRL
ncbi:hypothetical protein HETIRDRAFT_412382 [Heterobasidion irregulare TC 32-1]|uniref:Uncharacterized protein n=1 Tax=Heterobasidion irregulare (strain TC 32-1) TaxID=747525 RepID=W4JNI1_HETIT|nr:uncharacterized protein HETIRDRAFT_412382 [Heterobasidion irregulare TC 32-1]ETW75117.1 hypothetical protein HETIRDRAFT_412382 [Heterobasidion irregulare TC 32-1]